MWTRAELKDRAKLIMSKDYWKVFLICLITALLGVAGSGSSGWEIEFSQNSTHLNLNLGPFGYTLPLSGYVVASMIFFFILSALVVGGILLSVFVINVLRVGFCRYLIMTQRTGRSADASELFWGFHCGHYMNLVKTMFLHDLYIFLWGLLLIIPGIIKGLEYTCVPYILAEHPQMDTNEVFALSREMTDGEKLNIFILDLSFIGWRFLASFLFGIGHYFLNPYEELTNGELYAILRSRVWPEGGGDSYRSYDSHQTYTY